MNLVWLDLNSSYSHSSLALPAIEAQRDRERGDILWDVVPATLSTDIMSVVRDIVAKSPDIVAATAWLFTHDRLHDIMCRVKAILPDIIVIYGGPEFLGDNEDYFKKNDYVSAVFRGEGETEFHRWLGVVEDKNQWNKVSGLCYLDCNGAYMDGGVAKVADFASLNYPETSPFFRFDKAFVQLESTRGCFNSCAFCVSSEDKPVRVLDIEDIENRLENFVAKGIKEIRMLDRTFNGSQTRTLKFFEMFRRFNGRLRFHLEIHPALLTKEMRRELTQMPEGLLHLEAGMQSLNSDVLEKSSRSGELEKALDGLRFLCSLDNMETHADLIIGLPLYTLDAVYGDVCTLVEMNAGEVQLETLKLLPGTVMRRNAKELGLCFSPKPPYEVMATEHISLDEISEAVTLSKVLDGFYNADAFSKVFRMLTVADYKFLRRFNGWLHLSKSLDSPLSVSSRGELLYDFCRENYPYALIDIAEAWICNGLSMKKNPAGDISPFLGEIPSGVEYRKGKPEDATRFYVIKSEFKSVYIGFNRQLEHSKPIFIGYEKYTE